jgi:hypothetical protein
MTSPSAGAASEETCLDNNLTHVHISVDIICCNFLWKSAHRSQLDQSVATIVMLCKSHFHAIELHVMMWRVEAMVRTQKFTENVTSSLMTFGVHTAFV